MRPELAKHVAEITSKNIEIPEDWPYFRAYTVEARTLVEKTNAECKDDFGALFAFRNKIIPESPFPYLNLDDDEVCKSIETALRFGLWLQHHHICENTILRMFGISEQFCDQYPLRSAITAGRRFNGFTQRWDELQKIGVDLSKLNDERIAWVKLRNLIAHSAPGSWIFPSGTRSKLEWPYSLVEESQSGPVLLAMVDVESCEAFFDSIVEAVWESISS